MIVIPEGFFGDPPTQQLNEGDSPACRQGTVPKSLQE